MFNDRDSEAHLSDEMLIRLQDGELSSAETRRAKRHVRTCWVCSRRAHSIHDAVMNFVGVCDYALEELEPPDGWRTFASRLRAQRSRTAPLLSRLRPAWLTSAAAAAFAVWWLVLPSGVQPAQASEILAKSSIAQRRAWDTLPGAVVHQTLEITAGPGGKIGWDLWRAPKQARLAERWTGANALRVQIASVCKRSCLDSSDPLSAAAFQRWRDSVVKKSERVDQDKAHGNLTIRTEAESGHLSAASLTIRESDFHPVEQSLKIVSGDGVVDIRIREVSYEVVRMEDVPAGVFETPTVPLLTTSRSQKPVEAQSLASVPDLDVAEARLRQLLHELKIDTSLSPEIEREHGFVMLNLMVESTAQKEIIQRRTQEIGRVRTSIHTPEDPEETRHTATIPATGKGAPLMLERTEPPMARELASRVGSQDAANVYIARVHHAYRAALAPALALEQLGRRYPQRVYADLPDEARKAINEIAADYLGDTRARSMEFSQVLELGVSSLGPQPLGATGIAVNVPWQASASLLVTRLRSLDAAFNRLFVTHERAIREDRANSEVADLGELRRDLDAVLSSLQTPSNTGREE